MSGGTLSYGSRYASFLEQQFRKSKYLVAVVVAATASESASTTLEDQLPAFLAIIADL